MVVKQPQFHILFPCLCFSWFSKKHSGQWTGYNVGKCVCVGACCPVLHTCKDPYSPKRNLSVIKTVYWKTCTTHLRDRTVEPLSILYLAPFCLHPFLLMIKTCIFNSQLGSVRELWWSFAGPGVIKGCKRLLKIMLSFAVLLSRQP